MIYIAPPPCAICGGPMTEAWGPPHDGLIWCEACEPRCTICFAVLPTDPAAAHAHWRACYGPPDEPWDGITSDLL